METELLAFRETATIEKRELKNNLEILTQENFNLRKELEILVNENKGNTGQIDEYSEQIAGLTVFFFS